MSKLKTNRVVAVILSVLATAFGVAIFTFATSIGTNVTVTGALTVDGNSTLGNAVTDTVTFTARVSNSLLNASSTLLFQAGAIGDGGVVFEDLGSIGTDELGVEGAVEINGLTTLDGGFISAASSTHSTGVFNVGSSSFGVGTSTPSQELGVVGDIYVDGTLGVATSTAGQELGVVGDALLQKSSGTTSLIINSAGTGVGSCIQLRGANGDMFRVYAGATTTTTGNLRVESGSCL